MRTENSNKPHGFGLIDPENFTPFPKNPVIANFFREIGRADELGSGVRKMIKYGQAYGGSTPELIEGDVFRMNIKYPDSQVYAEAPVLQPEQGAQVTPQVTGEVTPQATPQVTRQVPDKYPTSTRQVLMALDSDDKELTRVELQKVAQFNNREHFVNEHLQPLLDAGFLEMTIPDKPRSSKQKYRLTAKGQQILENIQSDKDL